MADEFLSRWSRLKREARANDARPGDAAPPAESVGKDAPESAAPANPAPLPPVESLTPESDFAPFMGKDVDPGVRRQALNTLFQDPRFNVMDGLDTYIDDYSKPDPIPADWMGKLEQLARLGHEPDPRPEADSKGGAPEEAKPVAGTSAAVEPAQAAPPPKPLDSEGELAPPSDTPD